MLCVSDGRRTSLRTDSRGKYALPSTVTMSSDSAITVPFQVAVAMACATSPTHGAFRNSPAQRVHLPRLGRPAGTAVPPGDDAQWRRRDAALGALDGRTGLCPGGGDLGGSLLVDARVAPAGATEVSFSAASGLNGVPPG